MDNKHLKEKIELRKSYINIKKNYNVFNACSSDNLIWNTIINENYSIELTNIDILKKAGTIKANSEILAKAIYGYDIIDIDAYSNLWKWIKHYLPFFKKNQIIFLTSGVQQKNWGTMSKEEKSLLDIPKSWNLWNIDKLKDYSIYELIKNINMRRIRIYKFETVIYIGGIKN